MYPVEGRIMQANLKRHLSTKRRLAIFLAASKGDLRQMRRAIHLARVRKNGPPTDKEVLKAIASLERPHSNTSIVRQAAEPVNP